MNPNVLKATLLQDASTEQQKEFAKMLADQCAEADLRAKGHKCWFEIPDEIEHANMMKYFDKPCPKCGKGRIVVEIFHDSMLGLGDNYWLRCRNGEEGCDFKECANNDKRQ